MDYLGPIINNKYLKDLGLDVDTLLGIKSFLIEQAAYAVNTILHHDVTIPPKCLISSVISARVKRRYSRASVSLHPASASD